MRVGIIGSGAVGSYLGGLLASVGVEISLLARGSHGHALQQQGLHLVDRSLGSDQRLQPHLVSEDIAALLDCDWILTTVKAHSLKPLLPALQKVRQAQIPLIQVQNGIPWWYFCGTPQASQPLNSVDPGGRLMQGLDPQGMLGGVVYVAAEITAPGEVTYNGTGRLILGEILPGEQGKLLSQLDPLLAKLQEAQLNPTLSPQIRTDIWIKLWGNVALNPLSVLTRATQDALCEFGPMRALIRAMMMETQAIGLSLGIPMPADIDDRLDRASRVVGHRTSMLQDFEQGRPLEVETILGSVIELGQRMGIPTPHLDSVYAPVTFLDPGRR